MMKSKRVYRGRRPVKRKRSGNNYLLYIVVVLGLVLAGVCIKKVYKTYAMKVYIHSDVQRLLRIFRHIDNTCGIVGFSQTLNSIDFLNIKEFTGDQVGPMQVSDPEKWVGPYLEKTLTYHDVPFAILVHEDGYFIVPGDGTVLDSGHVIGKDIMFDSTCNLEKIMHEEVALSPNKKNLVSKIF